MPEKPGKNREQLKEITDRIEAGIRDIFESGDMDKYRNYLRTMSRFHNYSLNNQALIHLQRPDATLVAGYNRWRDKFSRHVLRGEKGITIIAPTPEKKKIEQEKLDPDTRLPILDADGNAEEVEAESISFMVCAYFGIETGANSFGYVATWSKNAELPEFRASLDTIGKTANGIITDVEKHFAEVCKERGIELPKDTEYELVTIPPSRADALAFAAEYAAFLRRDLNVPDSADKPTAEAVADRLLAGEDAELRKELEDFVKLADEIGIDNGSHGLLERFNGLFRQEWRAKEEPQPEVEAEKPNVEDELPPLPELEQGYPMPDTGIGFLEMYQYGYTDGNAMLPLTKERAMELFMQDVPVFLLYGDNTEAMALGAEDISSHTGVFGVEREEWDAVRGVVTLSEQADTEKLFLENPQDAFLIYQIRRGGELDAYRFMNYDYLQSKGVTPERGGYDAIYTGGFMDYGNARTNLDMIYQRFNVDHPADFKGHSLSVSDIVALKQNGVVSCHYVDSIGFRELPNFLKPENYLKNAEMAMEDDYGMIDGIINNGPKQPPVTALEEQVKAGFPEWEMFFIMLRKGVKSSSPFRLSTPSLMAISRTPRCRKISMT